MNEPLVKWQQVWDHLDDAIDALVEVAPKPEDYEDKELFSRYQSLHAQEVQILQAMQKRIDNVIVNIENGKKPFSPLFRT